LPFIVEKVFFLYDLNFSHGTSVTDGQKNRQLVSIARPLLKYGRLKSRPTRLRRLT